MPEDAGGSADLKVGFGAKPYATIQAAIDQTIADCTSDTVPRRRVIEVGPGFFEGPVVIPPEAPPITLRGAGAKETILAAAIDAQMPGLEYAARFAKAIAASGPIAQAHFVQITARQTIGTHNTAVLSVARDDVILTGLTIRNDYQCDRSAAAPDGAVPDALGRFAPPPPIRVRTQPGHIALTFTFPGKVRALATVRAFSAAFAGPYAAGPATPSENAPHPEDTFTTRP